MSIKRLTPPEAASNAATNRLATLERAKGRSPDLEAGGGIMANPDHSLPVYHLDCAINMNEELSLAAARPVGWQYLVGFGEDAKSVEVLDDVAVTVDRGAVALNIAHALHVAQKNVSDIDYEARMLTFGRVANPVLWLHPEYDGAERFFSLGPESQEVEPANVIAKARNIAATRKTSSTMSLEGSNDESGG